MTGWANLDSFRLDRPNRRMVMRFDLRLSVWGAMIGIEWTQALSVGMDEIDQQHQQLYSIIAQLIDARKQGLDHQSVLSILTRLVDYSDYHFRTKTIT